MRFKKEKYIREIKNKDNYSFQVLIPYRDVNYKFKQHSKTFNVKDYMDDRHAFSEAKKYRNEILGKLDKIKTISQKKTVEEVFKMIPKIFSSSYETQRKEKNIFYKYLIKYKDFEITELKLKHISECLNDMVFVATQDTIRKATVLWRKILKVALNYEYIDNNFIVGIIVPQSQVFKQPKSSTLNINDLKVLISYLNKKTGISSIDYNNTVYLRLIKVMALTGIRPSEAYALKKENIDFENKLLTINSMASLENRKTVIKEKNKTKKSTRTIPITDEIIEMFKNVDDDFLFKNFKGELLNSNDVSNFFYRTSKKLNINFRLYLLRHNLATQLIGSGADVRVVMELMGHANPSMSIDYARSDQKQKKKAIKKLSNMIKI